MEDVEHPILVHSVDNLLLACNDSSSVAVPYTQEYPIW